MRPFSQLKKKKPIFKGLHKKRLSTSLRRKRSIWLLIITTITNTCCPIMICLLLLLQSLKKILQKKLKNLRRRRAINLIKIKINERSCRSCEKRVFNSTS